MEESDDIVTIERDARERRYYDRLRSRIAHFEPGGTSGARDMILLLPDLTMLLMRLLRDSRVPLGAKLIGLCGVGYVLSPIDLVPSLLFGPVGLIDDLLIASATLSRLLNRVHPDVVRSHWSGKGDALEAIQRVTQWSETLFTGRLLALLRGRRRATSR